MHSTTGQLMWSEKGKGFFSINTHATKGFAGFTNNEVLKLGEVSLKTDNEFAVVFITSLDKEKGIDAASSILITTVARAQNTGMKFNTDHTELLERGDAPILLEPVSLQLSIDRKSKPRITVLDHSGRKTDQVIKADSKWISLDGATTKAIYYLLEY